MRSRSKRAYKRAVYTKGEINKLIDSLCHPMCKANPGILIVDGFIHGLVERNPPLSIRKFLKHNLPMLIEEVSRTYGREGYKTARELRKAVKASIELAERLKRRKDASMKL